MPWRVETVMSQRKEFVALARSEGVIMSELCLRRGISRKTGYKWLRRYLEGGEQRLDDLPKRPHHSPNRTSDDMEQLVVDLRREHPTKGGHVLARILKDRGHNSVPSKSTITAILRSDINLSSHLRVSSTSRISASSTSGPTSCGRWTSRGFANPIPVVSGGRCHPLTVLDDHSRFSLGVRACADERTQTVHDHLTSIFSHYGMPNTILVDNGSPWGSDVDHPFTPLTVWLVQLGVRVVHSRPYHPQTLGKLERFHGPSRLSCSRESAPTCPTATSSFDGWRDFYNLQRPHHALDLNTPASRYTVSPRPFPETLIRPLDYDTDDQVRSVGLICQRPTIASPGQIIPRR